MEATPEEIAELIFDCQGRESKLTPWEARYVSDLLVILEDEGNVTQKQVEKLEEIWKRVTGVGGDYV